jgi:DNA modification methylase
LTHSNSRAKLDSEAVEKIVSIINIIVQEKIMKAVMHSNDGKEEQLQLFETEGKETTPLSIGKSSAFSDPAFASNKTLPIHRWVPWIAGFSSDFVSNALNDYMNEKGTILDPFAGVGTTLVEATLQGHDTIGFEINPYAALACQTKLYAYLIDPGMLQSQILQMQTFYDANIAANYVPKSSAPKGFKTRSDFYSSSVLHKVLIFHDFVDTIESPNIKNLFKVVFAATMVRYSNYSYEPSLGRRVSSGKEEIQDFPVIQTIRNKLAVILEDIIWFQVHIANQAVNAQVINASFFQYKTYLAPESIDMIITSPPYLNNYHYNRNTRPQLYWLDYAQSPNDFKALENLNFGKYWQTVREQKHIGLTFSLPGTDIEERLQALRTRNPEKKIHGGNGWANYAASYFNDCYRLATGISYVLKHGATALVVIGNSILQGILMPTDQYFAKIAESVGLELVRIDIPRNTRVGNSIIQSTVRSNKAEDAHQLYEAVVELRKK